MQLTLQEIAKLKHTVDRLNYEISDLLTGVEGKGLAPRPWAIDKKTIRDSKNRIVAEVHDYKGYDNSGIIMELPRILLSVSKLLKREWAGRIAQDDPEYYAHVYEREMDYITSILRKVGIIDEDS